MIKFSKHFGTGLRRTYGWVGWGPGRNGRKNGIVNDFSVWGLANWMNAGMIT